MTTPTSTTNPSNEKMLLTPDNVYLLCRDFECAIVRESDALRPAMAKTLGAQFPTIAGSKMLCVPQRMFMLQVLLLINTLVTSLWDDVPEFVMPEDAEATFKHSLTMQAMAKRTTRPIRPHFDRASLASASASSTTSSSTSPCQSNSSDSTKEVTTTSTNGDNADTGNSQADQTAASTKHTPVKLGTSSGLVAPTTTTVAAPLRSASTPIDPKDSTRHPQPSKSSLRAPSPVSKSALTALEAVSIKSKGSAAASTTTPTVAVAAATTSKSAAAANSKTAHALATGTARSGPGSRSTIATTSARSQRQTAEAATHAKTSTGKSPSTNKKSEPPTRLESKTSSPTRTTPVVASTVSTKPQTKETPKRWNSSTRVTPTHARGTSSTMRSAAEPKRWNSSTRVSGGPTGTIGAASTQCTTTSKRKSSTKSPRTASARASASSAPLCIADSLKATAATSSSQWPVAPSTSTSSSTVEAILRDPDQLELELRHNIEDALECVSSLAERLIERRLKRSGDHAPFFQPTELDDDELECKSPIPVQQTTASHSSASMQPTAVSRGRNRVSAASSSNPTDDDSTNEVQQLIFG